MKKKLPFIIIGGVILLVLLGFGYVKVLQYFGGFEKEANTASYGTLTLTLPDDYEETTLEGRDVLFANGKFSVSINEYTTAYFIERGTTIETDEDFANFLQDLNPEYNFGKMHKAKDYVYFVYDVLYQNKSYSRQVAILENNDNFYVVIVECYTSSAYLLEDEFEKIMDTAEFN